MPSALRQIKLKLKDLELEEACLVSKKSTWLIGFSPEVMLGLDKFSYTQVSITLRLGQADLCRYLLHSAWVSTLIKYLSLI